MPALLISTSSWGAYLANSLAADWMLAESLTSSRRNPARPPAARSASTACWPLFSSRAPTMTWNPRRASWRAVSRPMPRFAPVMRTVRLLAWVMIVLQDVVYSQILEKPAESLPVLRTYSYLTRQNTRNLRISLFGIVFALTGRFSQRLGRELTTVRRTLKSSPWI